MNGKTAPEGETLKPEQTNIRQSKNPIQLTWKKISITAQPPKGGCGGRCKPRGALTSSKLIIDNVSGTIKPGQFLAIIGASGKHKIYCIINRLRRR
jgi:ABC-type multidrug transport system fused ATPase/permease subunit